MRDGQVSNDKEQETKAPSELASSARPWPPAMAKVLPIECMTNGVTNERENALTLTRVPHEVTSHPAASCTCPLPVFDQSPQLASLALTYTHAYEIPSLLFHAHRSYTYDIVSFPIWGRRIDRSLTSPS